MRGPLVLAASPAPPLAAIAFSPPPPQYPGIAESIRSDVDNLLSVLKMSLMLPEGEAWELLA